MFKFGISEYIRNSIYNVIVVLLLSVTYLACVLFLSNISEQVRFNNFIKPYLNEDSIIIGQLGMDFNLDDLSGYEKALMTKEVYCESSDLGELENLIIYDEYAIKKFAPRVIEGKKLSELDKQSEEFQVLISENSSGIMPDDIIEISFYGESGAITVPARVKGIIASGQKLLFGDAVKISKSMRVSEIFGTYNYEQLEYCVVVTTEEEFDKIKENIPVYNYRCIVKFDDGISKTERRENYQKILEYEKENMATGTDVFPESSILVEDMKEELRDTIIENIPYCVAILMLIILCIASMISIKVSNSMRYYATLYICGMPYRNAVVLSGVEMGINNSLALVVVLALVNIQNKYLILGEINCSFGLLQIGTIAIITVVIIIFTMLITLKILKERTPMSVLRDTAY